jgi:hypothetical protein
MTVSRIQQFELQLQREFAQDRAEQALRESPPALRAKVDWIRHYFEDEWRRSLVGRYRVAALIREIYDDVNENNGAAYGAKAVQAVKDAFGWDDGVIYHALHVAGAFTPEQIEEIARLRLPGGRPLSYSHVVALAGVEDERRRQNLLRQAVREGWTARQLVKAVDRAAAPQPGKPEDRRGRPLAKPGDFDAALDQQAHVAEDFLNRNDRVWAHPESSLSARAAGLDTAGFTRERAHRLQQHADQMNLLAHKAKERAEEAVRVHELFVQVLEQQTAAHKRLGLPAPSGAGAAAPA